MARDDAKPAGALTVSKTGQYTALKAFYAFNETSGTTIANLAAASDSLTLTGGGTLGADAAGRFYQPYGGAAAAAIPTRTLGQLGITAGGALSVFIRLRPPGFSEGTDRVVFQVPFLGGMGLALDTYGTIYELRQSFGTSIGQFMPAGERPATDINTVVFALGANGAALKVYVNGVLTHTTTSGPYVDDAGKLAVGYDPAGLYGNTREAIYEIGVVAATWSATQAAAYDAAPLGALVSSNPNPTPINHDIAASPIAAGAPSLASAALTQNHARTASTILAGAPVLPAAALSQAHALAPAALLAAAPAAPAATVAQGHKLTSAALSSRPPALSSPAATQGHALGASALAAGLPTLQSPAIAQASAHEADGIVTGPPTLGTPALALAGDLLPAPVLTAPPVLGQPAIVQAHELAPSALNGRPASLGAPALIQSVGFAPSALSAGNPAASRAALSQAHRLTASALSPSAPAPARAALSVCHVLAALGLLTGSPVLGRPSLNGARPTSAPRGPALPAAARRAALAAASRPPGTGAASRPFSPPAAPRSGP